VSENGQVMPIGHYGNGFKSGASRSTHSAHVLSSRAVVANPLDPAGSMRLGKDALVFTKSQKTQSVGLLSQVRILVLVCMRACPVC
jgi:hypothetical protein